MPSFDIVSKTEITEVDNALAGMRREIETRFDFKGSKCSIERKENVLTLLADDDLKLKQMHELLKTYMIRRKLDAGALEFKDVDRVTQWSYCSGGGGGLPVEKPEITAEISRRRVARAEALEVDALISACPWSERPLSEVGTLEVMDLFELLAKSAGIEVGGHTSAEART